MSSQVIFKGVNVMPTSSGLMLEFETEETRDAFLRVAYPEAEPTGVTGMLRTNDGVYLGVYSSLHVTVFVSGKRTIH